MNSAVDDHRQRDFIFINAGVARRFAKVFSTLDYLLCVSDCILRM
jgi:hypothetical protein